MEVPSINTQRPQVPETGHKTGFALVFGTLAVLCMAGIGAYYMSLRPIPRQQKLVPPSASPASTATPMPTTGDTKPDVSWKRYKDKSNTITLRHPSTFHETAEIAVGDGSRETSLGALSSVTPYNNGLDKESDLLLEFTLLSMPEGKTLEEYIQSTILTYQREDTEGDGNTGAPVVITPSLRKTIHPDGADATWLEGISFMSVPHAEIFIPYRENKVVHVRIFEGTAAQERRNQAQYAKNIQLAEQILSTFQFVE